MLTQLHAGPRLAHRDDSGLDELQVQAVRLAIYSVGAAALAFNLAVAFAGIVPRQAWLLVGVLLLTALLAHGALVHGANAAVVVLSVGLALTILVASLLFPDLPLACAFSLIVVLAGALVGPRAGLLAALGLTAVVALLVGGPWPMVAPSVASVALILLWVNVIASWLAARPLEAALEWSWQNYARAMRVADESRARQGELGRLAKSLNETCERLEELSRELERARRAAAEARRLKDEFASTVSHEMRTPLNLIIGFSEMMVVKPESHHGEPLPRVYRADAEAVYRNACHLSHLIDDVLDLAQIEAHRMALDKQPVTLARVVDEAVTSVSSLFERRGLTLVVDLPDDLPLLSIDRTRVRQILINLLSNAARFTSHGGITVTAARGENECVVSVADTGTGIPPEVLSRVFEEFRQFGQKGIVRTGSGLGLSISKRLAELHGGSMWVDSKVGEGSVFRFTLPFCDSISAVPIRDEWETWAQVTSDDSPRTLAVVDPRGECVRLLRRYLDGYRLLPVASIDEALRATSPSPVAAIIVARDSSGAPPMAGAFPHFTGVVPPATSSNGGDLCLTPLRVGGECPRSSNDGGSGMGFAGAVPIITCTVRGIQAIGDELGADAYLVKPVNQQQLNQVLERLSSAPRTVLVADDDPEMVRLLGLMVRGFPGVERVLTAPDGAAALALMHKSPPDLVLLDLLMPELDGAGVISAMRASDRLRKVPIVVITARGFTEERVAVSELVVAREADLSAAEFIRCLRASLDALLASDGQDSAPAPIVAPRG